VDYYRIGYQGEGKSSLLLSIKEINKSIDRRINEEDTGVFSIKSGHNWFKDIPRV
jgi:hypothetical protein